MTRPVPKTKQTNTMEPLRRHYAHNLKQVKHDYRDIIQQMRGITGSSLEGKEKLSQEFGKKVINKLILMQDDARKLGKDGSKLPSFIKQADLLEMQASMPMLFNKLIESDNWLRRLIGADKNETESHKKLVKRIELFKEKIKSNEAFPQFLPFLEKLEKGTLKQFNEIMRWRQTAANITQLFKLFCAESGSALHNEQAQVLAQILAQLAIISNKLIDNETRRFKNTEEYKKADTLLEQRKLLNTHMTQFEAYLSAEEQLDVLERVLKSQDKIKRKTNPTDEEQERVEQRKEDKKHYAPLFKHDSKAEKQGHAVDIIAKLSKLHETLVIIEAKRIMHESMLSTTHIASSKEDKKTANSRVTNPVTSAAPSRKRILDDSSANLSVIPSTQPEIQGPKKRKDENYERQIRFFGNENASIITQTKEEIIDMDTQSPESTVTNPF